MSDLEKLAAIRAKCVELLELAGKRTPGKWEYESQEDAAWTEGFDTQIAHCQSKPGLGMLKNRTERKANALFIASCAGPAEAGWRATIAAIDAADYIGCSAEYEHVTKAILAAWEGQV